MVCMGWKEIESKGKVNLLQAFCFLLSCITNEGFFLGEPAQLFHFNDPIRIGKVHDGYSHAELHLEASDRNFHLVKFLVEINY